MGKTVVIDCFPESVARWRDGYAVVAVDVVRSTTTAITSAALGRRCFPVASLAEAFALALKLDNPLLIGELRGVVPQGFDINNSPAALAARTDLERPAILLSSSGTTLLCQAASQCMTVFLACLRNHASTARYLAQEFPEVAVIAAGTRDEFREEDQMCCAWLADALMDFGYSSKDNATVNIVKRWQGARTDAWIGGKSAAYLRNSGQLEDLTFILGHVNDLQAVVSLRDGEVVMVPIAKANREEKSRNG